MKILALDIGGTEVKYGYFGKSEAEYGKFSVIDGDGKERLPQNIMKFIKLFDVDHIGICSPGPFDFKTGTGLMEHKLKSLYKVSLKEMIDTQYSGINTVFIHDSTAFVLGAIYNKPELKSKNFSGVMLGTGLGYSNTVCGKVMVSETETPLYTLWNSRYKDGIAEEYVSATAIKNRAKKLGYSYDNVLSIAIDARNGDKKLQNLFFEVGSDMGEILNQRQKTDGFESIVIGGQVSLSWTLMKDGFESVSEIPYHIVENPTTCAVDGIKYCIINGKENIYKKAVQNEKDISYNCG